MKLSESVSAQLFYTKRLKEAAKVFGFPDRPHEHHMGIYRRLDDLVMVMVWNGANGKKYRHEFQYRDIDEITNGELDLVRVKVTMSLC